MSKRRFLSRLLLVLVLLGVLGLVLPGGAPLRADEGDGKAAGDDDDDDGPTDFFEGETSFSAEQVNKAIMKGVSWLRKKQSRSGTWGEVKSEGIYGGGTGEPYKHPAGPTALALYALLKCKVQARDPAIKRGFDYLEKNYKRPGGTYEASALLLAVCATADNTKTSKASQKRIAKAKLTGRFRKWANVLADLICEKQVDRAWRYQVNDPGQTHGGENDLSSTQLVSLSLFSAHKLGVKVKPKIWEDILSYSMDQQADDGAEMAYVHPMTKDKRTSYARGFSYIKGDETPKHGQCGGSMTACGLANIMMARFVLSDGSRQIEKWNERPDAKKVQQSVYDGLAWLDRNWSPFENPPGRPQSYHIYYQYALERAMDLIGDALVGKHPWYSEMGQELLNRQQADGHWMTDSTHGPKDVLDTCFALLFLKRATKGAIKFPDVTGGSDDQPADNR